MYLFGSSLALAIVNIVVAATTKDDLLQGYRNGMWTLLGYTSLGAALFFMLYLRVETVHAGRLASEETDSGHKTAERNIVEDVVTV